MMRKNKISAETEMMMDTIGPSDAEARKNFTVCIHNIIVAKQPNLNENKRNIIKPYSAVHKINFNFHSKILVKKN